MSFKTSRRNFVVTILALVAFCLYLSRDIRRRQYDDVSDDQNNHQAEKTVTGMVVHVLTGASVMSDRLPRLFNESWWPDHYRLVYADTDSFFPEMGVRVLDVLASDPDLARRARASLSPEWVYYRKLQSGTTTTKKEFAGWQLDKWKFMAAHRYTRRRYPNADWYVSIDSDTFLFAKSLEKWLSRFEPSKPHYFGASAGSLHFFAHGGAGYAISSEAARLVFANDQHDTATIDESCCGDMIVADAIRNVTNFNGPDAGGPLVGGHFYYDFAQRLPLTLATWYKPIFTLHHVAQEDYPKLNALETQIGNDYVRYCDVFEAVTPPELHEVLFGSLPGQDTYDVQGWKLEATNAVVAEDALSSDQCNHACDETEDCLAWVFDVGQCRLSIGGFAIGRKAMLGETVSGYKVDKIRSAWQGRECSDMTLRDDALRLLEGDASHVR